jgi:hypothetical protein
VPLVVLPWGGEGDFILLNTPVEKVGNVGVAVGTLYGSDGQKKGKGIVIFHYDDEGNVIDYTFLNFDTWFSF